jgi:hypothetical protein
MNGLHVLVELHDAELREPALIGVADEVHLFPIDSVQGDVSCDVTRPHYEVRHNLLQLGHKLGVVHDLSETSYPGHLFVLWVSGWRDHSRSIFFNEPGDLIAGKPLLVEQVYAPETNAMLIFVPVLVAGELAEISFRFPATTLVAVTTFSGYKANCHTRSLL